MPIKRDSDGNIIEQPTKQADTAADGARPTDPVPPKQGKVNNPASGHSSYDAPTELAGTLRRENKQQGKPADPKTRIYRPGTHPPRKGDTTGKFHNRSHNQRTAAHRHGRPAGRLVGGDSRPGAR